MKKIFFITVMLSTVLLLTGCPGASSTSAVNSGVQMNSAVNMNTESFFSEVSMMQNKASKSPAIQETTDNSASSVSQNKSEISSQDRKYIRTVDLKIDLHSEDEYDAISSEIKKKVTDSGGIVTNSKSDFNDSWSSASMTVKVPAEKADDFLSSLEGLHKFRSISDNLEDITLHYTDLSSRLQSKEAQKKKYMEYLENSENMTDTMTIETELNNVIEDLEAYQAEMNVLNGQIDYTTISIDFNFTDQTGNELSYAEKFKEALKDTFSGLGDFVIGMISFILYLTVFCIFIIPFVWIIVKICRKIFRRKRKKGMDTAKNKSIPDNAAE